MNTEDIKAIFANRPIESDTTILGTEYAHYDDIPVLVENWSVDGITASSCIIPLEYLEKAKMEKDTIIDILKDKLSIEGQTTMSENGGFLFLNFNFEVYEGC